MAEKDGKLHTGHRQRMKERFLRDGLDGFAEHEVLELLLFYALPYRDTNDLGHRLEERFGKLNQVLDTNYADLISEPGITPHVATLITLCGQIAHRYIKDLYDVGTLLYTTEDIGRCVMPWFVGEKNESVVLLSLDNRYRLINATRVFSGSVNSTQFSCRIAVQQALRDNATQVVLAHNHPNGHAFYSDADVETTRRFRQATEMLGIRLLDHLIVSDGDFISLRDTPQTAGLFSNDRGRVSVVQNDGEVTDKVADREP